MSNNKLQVSYDNSDCAGQGGFVTGTQRPTDPTKIDLDVNDPQAHALLTSILASLGGAVNTTPAIYNVSCPVPGTEYSQALPANCKGFTVQARGNSKITYSYVTGATDTWTIPIGCSFEDKNFYTGQTVYFKCSTADVVEIVAYT